MTGKPPAMMGAWAEAAAPHEACHMADVKPLGAIPNQLAALRAELDEARLSIALLWDRAEQTQAEIRRLRIELGMEEE